MQCNQSYLFLILLLLSAAVLSGQSAHRNLRSGDKAYRNGAFEKAENSYRQASQMQPDVRSRYNLGNALYQQKKYDAAAKEFESAARSVADPDMRAKAFHNLGNAYFQQNQWDKAIEAYKAALRNRPGDAETARNLALAYRESKEQGAESREQSAESKAQRAESKEQSAESREPSQPETRNAEPGDSRQSAGSRAQSAEGSPNPEPETLNPKPGTRSPKPETLNPEPGTGRPSAEGNGQSQPGTLTRNPETDKLLQIMAREEQKVRQRLRRMGAAAPKSAKDW